jgi:hypothetical protein
MKNDQSLRNICVASIKRKTFDPFDFSLTDMFESETIDEIDNGAFESLGFSENELPIARTHVYADTWTLVTSRQIITCKDGIIIACQADKVLSWTWNDFKGYNKLPFTIGQLKFGDNQTLEIFIETGRASMVIIYAIRVLVGQLAK